MKVPKGMTQEEVVELILKIAKKHAKKREVDIYDDDDIVQECYLQCQLHY